MGYTDDRWMPARAKWAWFMFELRHTYEQGTVGDSSPFISLFISLHVH